MMSKISKGKVITVIFLLAAGAVALCFQSDLIISAGKILNWNLMPGVIWLISVVSVLSNLIFSPQRSSSSFIGAHFSVYADSVFAVATFGAGGSTSIVLLRGLYQQIFKDDIWFKGLNVIDMASIFIVSSFLLVYVLMNCAELMIGAVRDNESIKPVAAPDRENKM